MRTNRKGVSRARSSQASVTDAHARGLWLNVTLTNGLSRWFKLPSSKTGDAVLKARMYYEMQYLCSVILVRDTIPLLKYTPETGEDMSKLLQLQKQFERPFIGARVLAEGNVAFNITNASTRVYNGKEEVVFHIHTPQEQTIVKDGETIRGHAWTVTLEAYDTRKAVVAWLEESKPYPYGPCFFRQTGRTLRLDDSQVPTPDAHKGAPDAA